MEGAGPIELSCKENASEQMASDYSQYMDIDISKERKQFEESIDEMLTRLEEYLSIVSLIRLDTNLHLGTTISKIQHKSEEMEKLFEKVDQLEAFVGVVKQNVTTMEELVNKADSEMGSLSSLKKMFTNISMPSFLSRGKTTPKPANPNPAQKKFIPPSIFRTDDYLHYSSSSPLQVDPHSAVSSVTKSENTESGSKMSETSPDNVAGTWPEIGET